MGPDSEQARWAIREIKAFLDPNRRWIHSRVLVGSYALGEARKRSDADFLVLLARGEQEKRLSRILFDFELGRYERLHAEEHCKIQLVPLKEKEVEHLFEMSAPLSQAARHGVVIWDDGWFRTLLTRPYPKWPTRDYSVHAVTRWIMWQYYLSAVDLQREIRRDHGPSGSCTKRGKCLAHMAGDILARVISRMLYVTLPARGSLPLSKRQAVALAIEYYGQGACRPVVLAMNVLAKERGITHREFQIMFPFARRLFRECLSICGPRDPRILQALRDQGHLFRTMESKRRRGGKEPK